MKRTEAVKLIGKVLTFGKDGFPPDKKQKYSQMSLADIILTELEEAGMLPPVFETEPFYEEPDVIYKKEDGTYIGKMLVNEWEKEDDNNQLTDTK